MQQHVACHTKYFICVVFFSTKHLPVCIYNSCISRGITKAMSSDITRQILKSFVVVDLLVMSLDGACKYKGVCLFFRAPYKLSPDPSVILAHPQKNFT